jgi:signal transduction histidine kinase
MQSQTATMRSIYNNQGMRIAAVVTWAAILLSEISSNRNYLVPLMISLCVFLICYFIEEARSTDGLSWSLFTLCASAAYAVYVGGFGVTPALFVISATMMHVKLKPREFWLLLCAMNAVLIYRLVLGNSMVLALGAFVAYAGFQLFGIMMIRSVKAEQFANQELKRINAELIATRALLSESARGEERLNVSRELHDVAGHSLTALKLLLRGGQRKGSLSSEEINQAHDLADALLADIRSVVANLRDHEGIDLDSALKTLAERWQKPQVSVEIAPGCKAQNLRQAHALLRIAQEALTNSARHSDASSVLIKLSSDEQNLCLEVLDNGSQAVQLRIGNGLRGMQERVQELQGSLQTSAGLNGQGLRIVALVPLGSEHDTELLETQALSA